MIKRIPIPHQHNALLVVLICKLLATLPLNLRTLVTFFTLMALIYLSKVTAT